MENGYQLKSIQARTKLYIYYALRLQLACSHYIPRQHCLEILFKILVFDHVQNTQSGRSAQWLSREQYPDVMVFTLLPQLEHNLARHAWPHGIVGLKYTENSRGRSVVCETDMS